jgi:hypothetical protein
MRLLILLIAVMSLGACGQHVHPKEDRPQPYANRFLNARLAIQSSFLISQTAAAIIRDRWAGAVQDSQSIEQAVESAKKMLSGTEAGGPDLLKDVDDRFANAEKAMRETQVPPPEYLKAYDKLLELFAEAKVMHDAAQSPEGSLLSYSNQCETTIDNYKRAEALLSVLAPQAK